MVALSWSSAMRAFCYFRFSSRKQERGSSKERQIELTRELCTRNGWTIAKTFGDEGLSAWTGAHRHGKGKLGEFTADVLSGAVGPNDVLVVEKLDRLSREEVRIARDWIEMVCGHGLTIATTDGMTLTDAELRSGNMTTMIMLYMSAGLAKQESDQKSERVAAAVAKKLEAAKTNKTIITAKGPGWLKVNSDRTGWDKIESRVATVRLIYELAAEGHGRVAISKRLNEMPEHPAWGRSKVGPKTWDTTYIALLLKHPAVESDYIKGAMNPGRIKVKDDTRIVGYYQHRIVDADLVARARASVESRKLVGARHRATVTNLFAGFIRCAECGGRMHLRGNGDKVSTRQLQCQTASRNRGCSRTQMYRYDPFERAALDEILHLAMDDRFFRVDDQTLPLTKALAEAVKQVSDASELKAAAYKIMMRFPDDEDAATGYAAAIKAMTAAEARREEADSLLRRAKGAVSPAEHVQRVSDVRAQMDSPDPKTRETARLRIHEALKSVVDNVETGISMWEGEKMITMYLIGGAHTVRFNNAGQKILQMKPNDETTAESLRYGDDYDLARVEAYFGRKTVAR